MSLTEASQSATRFTDTFSKDAAPVLPPTVELFKLQFEIPQIQRTIDQVLLSIERTKNLLEGPSVFPEYRALLDSLVITLRVFTRELEEKEAAYLAITGKEFESVLPSSPIVETTPSPSILSLPPVADHFNGNGNRHHEPKPGITSNEEPSVKISEPEPEENEIVSPRKRSERIDYEALLEFVDAELYARLAANDDSEVPYSTLFVRFFKAPWTQVFNSRLNVLLPKLEQAAQARGLRLVLTPGKPKSPTTLRYAALESAPDDINPTSISSESSNNDTHSFQIDPEKDPVGAEMLAIMRVAITQIPELYSSFQEKRVSKLRFERVNTMLSQTHGAIKITRNIINLGVGSQENMTWWFSPREVAILVAVGRAGMQFGSKFSEVFNKLMATLPPEDLDSYSLPELVPTETLGNKKTYRKKK